MSKYIIEVDDNAVVNGCYKIVGTNNVLVSPNGLDELQKYEEGTEETVKELAFPQYGDEYYYIMSNGLVDNSTYYDDIADNSRMVIGNFFRTEEESEFTVERLKVLAEMRKFAEPFNTKWDCHTSHYCVYYDLYAEKLNVLNLKTMRCNELYFETKERANECIDAVGAYRIKKYYIGVE